MALNCSVINRLFININYIREKAKERGMGGCIMERWNECLQTEQVPLSAHMFTFESPFFSCLSPTVVS